MIRVGKDVSIGEYDPMTGLTHITRQRGRLLFNMGASFKKQQCRRLDTSAKTLPPPTSTGPFTGLSLYPEEANYLLQRRAITIYLMPQDGNDAQEISMAAFTTFVLKSAHVSLACMTVYGFLKNQKLHPRRCLKPLAETVTSDGSRCNPRHWTDGERCDVAFEVWKTVLENAQLSKVDESVLSKRKQSKMLVLVFRVVVCRFGDTAPTPRNLRLAADSSHARDGRPCDQVPIKIAVVHHDSSVVLFEISVAP